jgi:hypothetical protein
MKLDSSWELSYVIYCQDHDVLIERNTEKFPYTYRGKAYRWIPDFYVGGEYVEIKGRENQRTAAKFRDFKHPLTILRRLEMKPILQYVINKYGIDFHRLYE